MLCLTRKVGERIHLGGDIYIEVRKIEGSRVTVAISAPPATKVLRGELLKPAKGEAAA